MTDSSRQTLLASVPTSFETGPAWLRELRGLASKALHEQGLPSKRTESWRFTPVRSVVDAEFSRGVDGVPSLLSELPDGVSVRSLKTALQAEPELLKGRLDIAGEPSHFAALNTALFDDGLWIDVPAGRIVEAPLEIAHAIAAGSSPGVVYPRVLVTLGDGAALTLIETYASAESGQLSNSVVEVDLGPNARMSHVRVHENAGMQV